MSALLKEPETLLPAAVTGLQNPLVYSNARALDSAYARWLHWSYAARDEIVPAVQIGRYAPGCLLDGEGFFLVLTEGALVAEQVPHAGEDLDPIIASLNARAATPVDVDRSCLLACRFGEWTWGHWLLDMLPKIAIAERRAPLRFTYAVPFGIVDPSFGHYASSVLSSLAAYGVEPSRLLRVRPGAVYRFKTLFDVAGVSGKRMHPGLLDIMHADRACERGGDVDGARRSRTPLTAMLRGPPSIRCLVNSDDVRRVLQAEGAMFVDPLTASFADQVAAFRDSDIIVGDLGSNLATAIYAGPGTGLVTLAPAGWRDDYFISLFQRLNIVQADIRGPALPAPGQPFHHAPTVINPAHLETGLKSVRDAMKGQDRPARGEVDGRAVAHAPGPVVAEITFGSAGNAAHFRTRHLGAPEISRTWSLGPECQLVIPCPSTGEALWLEVVGGGFVTLPHLVSRPLAIWVNGTPLAEFDVDDPVRLHVLIPAGLTAHGELVIDFHHRACPSPQAMGVSPDARPLGFMFERVALRRLSR